MKQFLRTAISVLAYGHVMIIGNLYIGGCSI